MISCKFGEMGCILTRKILLGVVLLVATLTLLAYRIHTLPEYSMKGYHHHHENGISIIYEVVMINDTWVDF